MSTSNLSVDERETILDLIYQERTHSQMLRPVAITRVDECDFFRNHNNSYEGFFIDVQYADGRYEIWFVVDIRGGLSDDDWFIQKIR